MLKEILVAAADDHVDYGLVHLFFNSFINHFVIKEVQNNDKCHTCVILTDLKILISKLWSAIYFWRRRAKEKRRELNELPLIHFLSNLLIDSI